jgi:hypothetical protein
MRWPQRYPTRGDVMSVLFVLVVVCLIALRYIWFPQPNAPNGFGPDWDCIAVSKGEPICMKKLGR